MPNIHELVAKTNRIKVTPEIKQEIEQKIQMNHFLEERDENNMTALMHAKKIEIVELLIKYGADVNAISSSKSGNQVTQTSVLFHLLNLQDSKSWTDEPSDNAQKVVKALLDNGANPNFGQVITTYKDNTQVSEEKISVFSIITDKNRDTKLISYLVKAGGDISNDRTKLLISLPTIFGVIQVKYENYEILCSKLLELINCGLILSDEEVTELKFDIDHYLLHRKDGQKKDLSRQNIAIKEYNLIKENLPKLNEEFEKAMLEHNFEILKFKKDTAATEMVCKDLYSAFYAEANLSEDIVNKIKRHISGSGVSPAGKQAQIDFANKFKTEQGKDAISFLRNLDKYKASLEQKKAERISEKSAVSR